MKRSKKKKKINRNQAKNRRIVTKKMTKNLQNLNRNKNSLHLLGKRRKKSKMLRKIRAKKKMIRNLLLQKSLLKNLLQALRIPKKATKINRKKAQIKYLKKSRVRKILKRMTVSLRNSQKNWMAKTNLLRRRTQTHNRE